MHQMPVAPNTDDTAVRSDGYEAVAQLVAPTAPPSWLRDYFADWAPGLTLDSGVVKRQPTRKVMNRRLLEVSGAALRLEKALADTAVREFLESAGRLKIENLGGLQVALQQIARHAQEAANSPELTTASGTVRAGRGVAKPPDSFDPKTFCAVIVVQAWKFIRGKYPAPRNQTAARACEVLWKAAVGRRDSWGDQPQEAWRPYLKKATSEATSQVREECQRHLETHARLADGSME